MTVKAILAGKGDEVISVGPDDSVGSVAKLLADRRIGAVLAMDGGKIAGIVSERDIVRSLAAEGPDVLGKPARHIMTRNVKRCAPGDTVEHVMEMMTEGRFRHLPVCEGNDLVGFISIGDVVRRRIGEVEREAESVREYVAGVA